MIGTSWVVTAAHCIANMVRNGEEIYIRVGDHDLTDPTISKFAQTMKVSTTYIHHNHNSQTLDNDIALLRMESPVELSDAVCLVCLPTRGSSIKPGKKCTVSGYGYTSEGEFYYWFLDKKALLLNFDYLFSSRTHCSESTSSCSSCC